MASTSLTPTGNTSQGVRLGKRRGNAQSCAECRRLKLKCTRLFPCSNCVKKGCGAICPEGALTTGKGNRFVLANTQELHEKISVLANRVRDLEDGLAQSHALNSHESHPLLSEEFLQIKRPLERERPDDTTLEDQTEVEDTTSSLGSLSLSDKGQASFHGQQTNSWYLLQIVKDSDGEVASPTLDSSPGPSDIPWLGHAFPFSAPVGVTAENVRQMVMSKLPTLEVARMLRDIYYRHAAWMYTPITEYDFEVIFRQIYDQREYYDPPRAANLAVFCMVLALGALLDLDKPPKAPEAMLYYHLSRAVLSIESVLEEHSLVTIQALLLMSHFMFLSDMNGPRWVLMGIVVKMALSVSSLAYSCCPITNSQNDSSYFQIGLHRDTGKWKVESEETQKRRELFYELFTYDSWQSLTFGRPPSFSMSHVDNQMPHSITKNENGEVEMSYCAWKHRFSSQCLSIVHDQAFGTRPLNYKHLQDLDKKVRNWYIPPSLQVPGFGSKKIPSTVADHPTVQLTMQRYTVFSIKEITLFYMHRGFFAQALRESPSDPMGSKYSHSVLAAYNSATSFVNLIESLFNQHPGLTERMWFLFTHVFSCSLVLGEIAMKPNMVFARSALSQLKAAYNLFAKVSDTTKTSKILPILSKLKERALSSLSNAEPEPTNRLNLMVKSEVDDILGPIGGMTSLVMKGSSSTSPSVSEPSPQSSPLASIATAPTHYISQHHSSPSSTWRYHQMQLNNLNLPMDIYPASFSLSGDMVQDGNRSGNTRPDEMRLLYEQQHQLQSHLQSGSYEIASGMDMEQLPPAPPPQGYETFFGGSIAINLYGQQPLFNGHGPLMHPSNNNQYMPQNPQDSWQNFEAQYKP